VGSSKIEVEMIDAELPLAIAAKVWERGNSEDITLGNHNAYDSKKRKCGASSTQLRSRVPGAPFKALFWP
jgi:hypothetical protein